MRTGVVRLHLLLRAVEAKKKSLIWFSSYFKPHFKHDFRLFNSSSLIYTSTFSALCVCAAVCLYETKGFI